MNNNANNTYNEPTIPARPGDKVNFMYVDNYDPKKYYKNVSGGLTRFPTKEEQERDDAFNYYMNN
jgi:hypothetical protein